MSIGEPTFYVQISHPFSFNEWYKYIMKHLFSQSHSRPLLRCPHIPQTAGIGNPIPFSCPFRSRLPDKLPPQAFYNHSMLYFLSKTNTAKLFSCFHGLAVFFWGWLTYRQNAFYISVRHTVIRFILLLNRLRGCKPSPLSLRRTTAWV